MKMIYKYHLPNSGPVTVSLPIGSKPVHVALQFGQATLWAEVPTEGTYTQAEFYVAMTGEYVNDNWSYVGTVCFDDSYVVHVYWLPTQ